jgi:hypothetical protein
MGMQALGHLPQPLLVYPRSGQLIDAALGVSDEEGQLGRLCPPVAALLRECLQLDRMLRPCAREVLDRLLGIGATLGLVEQGL